MRKIILASTSTWRKDILHKSGIPFTAEASYYHENMDLPLLPRTLAKHLALGKAKAVAKRHKDAIVIGADTFAVFNGRVLGKPGTPSRARAFLKRLRGRTNTAITGFAIIDTKSGKTVSRAVETRVHFRKLSNSEIDAYVKTGEPVYAGGGYTIQGKAAALIDRIDGDFYNIVGLPLAALMEELKKFSIRMK